MSAKFTDFISLNNDGPIMSRRMRIEDAIEKRFADTAMQGNSPIEVTVQGLTAFDDN